MKKGVVNFKTVGINGVRLDSKFHLSDGLYTKMCIEKSPYPLKTVGGLSINIFYGNRAKRIYVNSKDKGIPFIGSSDMLKSDISRVKLISKKYTHSLNDLTLKRGWILVSRSGTIGNTVYTNELHENKIGSEHIIRIISNEDIFSGFLYSYLSSKYGYSLLTQGTFGAVIQHIEPAHIANISVPIFPESKQQEIHNLIVESANLRVEANRLLEEAVIYFDEKIKTSKMTEKFFTKKINDISFSWASYNNNKECDIINNQIKNNSVRIEEISERVFAPPMFKHIYLSKDNGNPFLTGAELTRQNPKFYRWLSPRGVKDINDYKVKKGTLLLYKSGTTDGGILGNVFIADDQLDGVCLSDHVIRIEMNKLTDAYWAYAFFKSKAGIQLLLRMATGTMIPFITPERLQELSIPLPDDEYGRITNLIDKYISKRVLANNKENQAIQLVEKEIESWQ